MTTQSTPQNSILSGLDLSKTNLYDTSNDQLQNLQNAQQDILKGLESRYAQPNWWKIAAGFAKPQLGGFMASLGSASEAMGENLEKQRALAIPIAQMKSQIAQNNILLSKNKDVSDEIQAWYHDPKNSGKLPPDNLVADWRARAPDAPAVKSIDTQIGIQQKSRDQAIHNIEINQKMNLPPDQADLDVLGRGKPTQTQKPVTDQSQESKVNVLPIDPKKEKEGKPIDFGFAQIHPDAASTPLGQEKIKNDEASATAKLDAISTFGHPINNQQYRQNINQVLDYVAGNKEHQKIVDKVLNVMGNDSKLQTAFMNSVNEGLHGNLGSMSGSIGAPIKTFIDNFRDPEERKVAQMLTMAIDNANFAQGKIKGLSTTAQIPTSEASLITSGMLSRDLNYHTVMDRLLQLDNSFDMYKNIYEGHRYLRKEHVNELTPYAPNHQIYNSDWLDNLINEHGKKAKEISDRYNKNISH